MANSTNLKYDVRKGETAERVEIIQTFQVVDENDNMQFVVHKLKKILNDNSDYTFYKASAFFRLTRVSKLDKENKKFLDVHTDIMRAMYTSKITTIEVIANVLKPTPEGLIFLYGVQATGNSQEEAVAECKANYAGFLASFRGTHRTAHIAPIQKSLFDWIFSKLRGQKYTSVIKGIPSQRAGSGANKNQFNFDNETEEQIEEFLAGSAEMEFCLMIMATPMSNKYLNHWLSKSLEVQTKWESQKQGSKSLGLSVGIPMSISMNASQGTSTNSSRGTSDSFGTSKNLTQGTNKGHSEGTGTSDSDGTSVTEGHSEGTSENHGTSDSYGSSKGTSFSSNDTHGTSENHGTGSSVSGGFSAALFGVGGNANSSKSTNDGYGSSDSHSTGEGYNSGTNESHGKSDSYGSTESDSLSIGKSSTHGTSSNQSDSTGSSESSSVGESTSKGTNASSSQGKSFSQSQSYSTGLNVGFNMSKTYQWVDKTVDYICQCLEMQNKRLERMLEGSGGFFCDVYLATDSPENLKAMEALAVTTWVNPNAKIDVLRMETPTRIGQKNILEHMKALSPCLEIEMEPDGDGYYYKYSSVVTSDELASYTHLPRITIGGIDNAMEDLPPVFRVPTDCQNKPIMIGNILNTERYSLDSVYKYGNGYVTDFKFGISQNEMHHAFISGGSRSGKSVLAERAVKEAYNNCTYVDKRTNEVKHKRMFILDPKGEWRLMASLVPKGKFKFYSVGRAGFHPLPLNLLRVPVGVQPYNYFNLVIEHFCSAYGLLDRAIAQIGGCLYELYERNDVFGHEDDPTWANEHSKNITLEDIYNEIEKKLHEAEMKRNNHDAEALQTYLTRLDMYHRKHSMEYVMFCNRGGDSCDILLGEDDLTVVESNGLSEASQRFFFILFMNAIYECALAKGSGGFYNGSYETVIVLEEANSILISAGNDDTSGQKSINRFNQILDKSASLGLFIWTITQKIASMPKSIIANSGICFIGCPPQDEDQKVVMATLGFDARKDVSVLKLLPRLATGIFIGRIKKGMSFEEQTPFIVKSKMLRTYIPDNNELEIMLQEHELARMMKE